MRKLLGCSLALVFGLSACGGGPSDKDRQIAEDFCAGEGRFLLGGMGIDKYDNPEGFDRCVDDAAEVTECLGPASKAADPWIPPDCEDDGYVR